MARNKEVVGGEQKLKSHWARCGSSGEAQWSNHFPRNGLGQLPSRWIEVREDTLAKSLHSPLRDRPWDCPCCLKKCFLWNSKNNPKQKSTPPTNVCPIIKYRKKSLSLQKPRLLQHPCLGGGEGVGWCRLHCRLLFGHTHLGFTAR